MRLLRVQLQNIYVYVIRIEHTYMFYIYVQNIRICSTVELVINAFYYQPSIYIVTYLYKCTVCVCVVCAYMMAVHNVYIHNTFLPIMYTYTTFLVWYGWVQTHPNTYLRLLYCPPRMHIRVLHLLPWQKHCPVDCVHIQSYIYVYIYTYIVQSTVYIYSHIYTHTLSHTLSSRLCIYIVIHIRLH